MSERLQKRQRLAEAMGDRWPARFTDEYGCEHVRLPDPWTFLDDCAVCDTWIEEHKGASYEPVLVRQTAVRGWRCAVTGTPSRWEAYYMFNGEDSDVFFGLTLSEAWAHAIYSVVVGDE